MARPLREELFLRLPEDAHKKNLFSGRTTKVLEHTLPSTLVVHIYSIFSFDEKNFSLFLHFFFIARKC